MMWMFAWPIMTVAQGPAHGEALYPEKLHADLLSLQQAIASSHPDPYRYLDSSKLADAFLEAREGIRVPLSSESFQRTLNELLQKIGDRRCHAELPSTAELHLHRDRTVIPLRFLILPEGLYVEDELKGFRSLPPGAQILSINGVPADTILARTGALFVTDGSNTTYRNARLEQELPWAFRRVFGPASSHTVRYRTSDGTVGQQVLTAMTGAEIERSGKPAGVALLPWQATWEEHRSTLWVTMRTLDEEELTRSGQRTEQFLKSMLKELKRNKARALVLDLRGAGGRELAMAERVFRSFAQMPFRLLKDITARELGEGPLPPGGELVPPFSATTIQQFSTMPDGSLALRADDPRAMHQEPMAKAFKGKVFVVCDGMTCDAAAALVMLARRTGRAKIVGEETGSNATSFTGGRELQLTLPNSGVLVHIPLMRYVPEGQPNGPADRGEMPHYPVQPRPEAVARGKDPVRSALLDLIGEMN